MAKPKAIVDRTVYIADKILSSNQFSTPELEWYKMFQNITKKAS